MKSFNFKDEWIKHNKLFGVVVIVSDIICLFVYDYITKNTNGQGQDLNIESVIIITIITLIAISVIISFTYIIAFIIRSKNVDNNNMFPEIDKCSVFMNIGDLSISSKEEILAWYNVVEYDIVQQIENKLDPDQIKGTEHVWLVTSDLSLELDDNELITTMKKNIDKGIQYSYFLPDKPEIKLDVERLNNLYGDNKIKTIFLNNKIELLFDRFDVIIFDPINDYKNCYICVDFNKPRKYRKITEDDSRRLISMLRKLMEKDDISES
ncbi:MAG: hypothetical protein IJV48_04635 [Ruminococcus sp.]|nr:hypothetical protein [Ruminococcus sp.]